MPDNKIDLNSANVGELTQLPGINKTIAYNIVNQRERHGLFTAWEELRQVKDFPIDRLQEIRERAELRAPAGEENFGPPRHIKQQSSQEAQAELGKRNLGYTGEMRSTRRPDRLHDTHDHSQHGSAPKKGGPGSKIA
jgi:Helix-hairpin-helix motif